MYQKSSFFELKLFDRTEEDNKAYSNPDNDPKGLWRTGDVRNALYRPNLIYDLETKKEIPRALILLNYIFNKLKFIRKINLIRKHIYGFKLMSYYCIIIS